MAQSKEQKPEIKRGRITFLKTLLEGLNVKQFLCGTEFLIIKIVD